MMHACNHSILSTIHQLAARAPKSGSAPCRHLLSIIALFIVTSLAPQAVAQCPAQWLPSPGLPGVNGHIYCTTVWDPDGPGPRSSLIAVGGWFSVAGNTRSSNIAAWDPATGEWTTLGSGMDREVYALTA